MPKLIEKFRELNRNSSLNKLTSEYFQLLADIQELKKRGNFKKMLKYCHKSLQFIEPLVVDTKRQYGEFDIQSIPAIEIGATFWAASGDEDRLLEIKEIVDYFPELNPWKETVKGAFIEKDIASKIYQYVKNNEGFEQKRLKKALVIKDSGLVSPICYYMALVGRLKRKKKGNTYSLFV